MIDIQYQGELNGIKVIVKVLYYHGSEDFDKPNVYRFLFYVWDISSDLSRTEVQNNPLFQLFPWPYESWPAKIIQQKAQEYLERIGFKKDE